MSLIDSLTLSSPGVEVTTEALSGTFGVWSCFSTSLASVWPLSDSCPAMIDPFELGMASLELRSRCKAEQYVRLRSRRYVSLNRMRNDRKMRTSLISRK